MLSVLDKPFRVSVILLNVVMLSVVMLSVVMLSVVMLNEAFSKKSTCSNVDLGTMLNFLRP
jgi:hypothetical protein